MTMKSSVADYTTNNDKIWGIYRGVVEDNKDPDRLCRCRIRILGVHDELLVKDDLNGIPTEELPWSEPCYGLFQGSVSGNGTWMVPLQGSYVFVFFENGNWMQPRYFLSAPGLPELPPDPAKGFNDPAEEWPDAKGAFSFGLPWLLEPDTHRLMKRDYLIGTSLLEKKLPGQRIANDIAIGGAWDEYPPMYQAKYPYNNVFHSYKGTYVEIDNTDANERFHLYHPSNSYLEIGPEGNMTIRNALDRWDITMNFKFEETVGDYHRLSRMNRTSKTLMSEYEEVMITSYRKIHVDDRKDVLNVQEYYIVTAEILYLEGWRSKFIGDSDFEYVTTDKTTYVGANTLKYIVAKYDTYVGADVLKWHEANYKRYVLIDDLTFVEGNAVVYTELDRTEINKKDKTTFVKLNEQLIVKEYRDTYVKLVETKQVGDVLILRAGTKIIIEAPEIVIRGGKTDILTAETNIAEFLTWGGIAAGTATGAVQAVTAVSMGSPPVEEVVVAVPEDPVEPPPDPEDPEKPEKPPEPPVPPVPAEIPPPPPPPVPPVLDYSDEPPEPDVCK